MSGDDADSATARYTIAETSHQRSVEAIYASIPRLIDTTMNAETTEDLTEVLTDENGDPESAEVLNLIVSLYGSTESFLGDSTVQEEFAEAVTQITDIVPEDELESGFAIERNRPSTLRGVNTEIQTGYRHVYITINEDENGDPFEIFCNTGKSGGLYASYAEALGKLVSKSLRSGADPEELAQTLTGIRSPKVAWDNGTKITSIPDAIGTALTRYLEGTLEQKAGQTQISDISEDQQEESNASEQNTENPSETKDAEQQLIDNGEAPECPECGDMDLYFSEGCKTCESCGWSEC